MCDDSTEADARLEHAGTLRVALAENDESN